MENCSSLIYSNTVQKSQDILCELTGKRKKIRKGKFSVDVLLDCNPNPSRRVVVGMYTPLTLEIYGAEFLFLMFLQMLNEMYERYVC